MKYPKQIKCPECGTLRIIDYRHLWLINKGKTTTKCFNCSRLKSGQINTGSFKRGNNPVCPFKSGHTPWNKDKPGYKTKPRNISQRIKDSERQRGENAPNWKGGRSELSKLLRQCIFYKLWRESIFKRDNFQCALCGVRSGKLCPDHYPIQMAALIDGLILEMGNGSVAELFEKALNYQPLWDIKSGRTLCYNCHKNTDSYGKNITSKRINQ